MKEHTMNAPDSHALLHYHFKVETITDKYGSGVLLTQQDDIQEPVSILVHPWQLRAACQHLGILHADPDAEHSTARLIRRMRSLAQRIEHLNDCLHAHQNSEHTGPTHAQTYSQATADLAAEFCRDLDERFNEANSSTEQARAPEQGALL